jgi:hypothetical protein
VETNNSMPINFTRTCVQINQNEPLRICSKNTDKKPLFFFETIEAFRAKDLDEKK